MKIAAKTNQIMPHHQYTTTITPTTTITYTTTVTINTITTLPHFMTYPLSRIPMTKVTVYRNPVNSHKHKISKQHTKSLID